MEGVERYKVKLLPHNAAWDKEYEEVKEELIKCWGSHIIDVQHVGSTAIKSICAKPILDVAVCLDSIKEIDAKALIDLGYEYFGAQNEAGTRHYFVLRGENEISLRHIHCYDKSDEEYGLLVGFRDYLNSHLETALQYQELKMRLAEQNPEDRRSYTKAKETFILSVFDKIKKERCENGN